MAQELDAAVITASGVSKMLGPWHTAPMHAIMHGVTCRMYFTCKRSQDWLMTEFNCWTSILDFVFSAVHFYLLLATLPEQRPEWRLLQQVWDQRVKNVKAGGGGRPWRKNQYIILPIFQWTIEVFQVNIFQQVLHLLSGSFIYTVFPYVFYENNMWGTAESLTNHQDSCAFCYLQGQLFSDGIHFDWYSCSLLANQCWLFVLLSGCLQIVSHIFLPIFPGTV